jgi:hypothetical protein
MSAGMFRTAISALTTALLTLRAVNAALPESYLIQAAGKTSVVVRDVQIADDDSYFLVHTLSMCENCQLLLLNN